MFDLDVVNRLRLWEGLFLLTLFLVWEIEIPFIRRLWSMSIMKIKLYIKHNHIAHKINLLYVICKYNTNFLSSQSIYTII